MQLPHYAAAPEEQRDGNVVDFADRRGAILRARVSTTIEDARSTYVRTAMNVRHELRRNVGLEDIRRRMQRIQDAAIAGLGGSQALEDIEADMDQLDLLCTESALYLRLLEDGATRSELEDAAKVLRFIRAELPVWRGEQLEPLSEDSRTSLLEDVLSRYEFYRAEELYS